MTEKETWFIVLEKDGKKGIGECGILRGLSADDRPDYEEILRWTCENIHLGENQLWEALMEFPSIQFGVEMAFRSLDSETPFLLFPSDFTKGEKSIEINGLVWMGKRRLSSEQQIEENGNGFSLRETRNRSHRFDQELQLLRYIRQHFTPEQVEIRVDANGAFDKTSALDKLIQLYGFELHSIEQPIQKNNTDSMAELCKTTPIPIALDEELIGVFSLVDKEALPQKIKPQYIILKPSFVGGFRGSKEWIALAEKVQHRLVDYPRPWSRISG